MQNFISSQISPPFFSRSQRRWRECVYTFAARCQFHSVSTVNKVIGRFKTTAYDYLGNAVSVRQTGNITDEIFAEFEHNANGLLTTINRYEEDENDVLTAVANSLYEYNANNAVTSITHKNPDETQIVKHSYTYDETNNIVEYLNSIDGATSYDYDFLGQLIGADHANQTDESYIYDSNGNRITANGSNYTTGDNNELTYDGDYTYTYDAEGNRVSKTNSAGTERELYTWDHRNRLTTVTKQTYDTTTATWTTVQIVEYAYDYNNVWIRKTVDTNGDGTADSKSIFIPEAYQTAVQLDDTDLTDSAGPTVTHHYLWTPNQQDKLLADTTTTDVLWSLTDHLGTIRDILGSEDAHLIYDAFGNLISGTNPLLFGYTGKAFDTATNLQNNINRWYDVKIGRWLSTDPIGFSGGYDNLFKYVANNPVSATDPSGLVLNSIINYIDTYSRVTSKVTEVFDKIKGALGGKEIQVSPNFNIQIESRTEMCEFGCRHEIKEVSITANSLKGDITVNRHGAVSLGSGPNSLKVNANVYIIASVDFNLKAKAIFEHKCLGHLGLAGIYFYKGGGIESQRFDIGIQTGFNLNGNLEIKGKSIVNANAQAYLTGKIVGNFEFIHKPTIANFNHSGFLRLSAQGVVHGGVTIKMNGQTLYELSVGSQTPVLVFETQLF